MNKGQDEAVWFSMLCAGFAFMAARTYPSTWSYLLVLLMAGWTFWSVYKMLLDRL
nr:hypothetical protein [Polymorphobacter sp.]